MANLSKDFNKNFFDSILPQYGNYKGKNFPIWDESQKMFICHEYESTAGHRYYKGARFSNRHVIIENVGLYHNWSYIDSLELYVFDKDNLILVQKKNFNKTFYDEELIRAESEKMLRDYLQGQAKISKTIVPANQIADYAQNIINESYTSFLSSDYENRLTQILPALEQ